MDKTAAQSPGERAEEEKDLVDRVLSPAAKRALAEAAERRAAQEADAEEEQPKELGGQDGPEPTRYGDWERKGVISDF